MQSISGPSIASSPLSASTQTHAFAFDHDAPPIPTVPIPEDVAFAVASKGIISATECLASIDMAEAPQLSDHHVNQFDVASCLATPVIPDQNNGELVQQRAARLSAQSEVHLRLRYMQEISGAAVRSSIRRLTRKRSLDDLDLHEAIMYAEENELPSTLLVLSSSTAKSSATTKSTTKSTMVDSADASPDGHKRIMMVAASMDDVESRHRLELDAPPEPLKPDESISLEEPDHKFLIGSIGNNPSLLVAVNATHEKDRKKDGGIDNEEYSLSETSTNKSLSSSEEKGKHHGKRSEHSNVMPFRRRPVSSFATEN